MCKEFVQPSNGAVQAVMRSSKSPVGPQAEPSAGRSARRTAGPGLAAAPDRKRDILLAAEKLFATQGYDSTTIRQIAREASVPLALVGYYYGPKQALFVAIFASWNHTIEERLEALRRAAAAPSRRGTLKHIIEAFVDPVLKMRASAEGEYYALLVARELLLRRPETDLVLSQYFDPMAHAFIDALSDALPGATRVEVAWCYQFALGALMSHMSDTRIRQLSRGRARPNDPAAHALLLRFIEAGIRAVVKPRNSAVARPRRSIPSPATKTRRQA